ncbi:hypothetical protein M422DRAFT_53497 [Sphaerobolus stellatus SS14]|uniref:DNA 3'-5' helicase n=1 Tax=Sphaerobolus stellatus (strain SS14) TaxID=990650 RepID=A0A0C9U9L9_SPHS4|nr:hypothetical protein M422DRAFT_53497 [Sphaerobolus stellatus SS14]
MGQDIVMESPSTSLQHTETSSLNICHYEQPSSLNICHFEQPSSLNNTPHKQLPSSSIILQEQSSFTIPPHSLPPLRDLQSEQRRPIAEAQSAPPLTNQSYSQQSFHRFNILDPKDPLHTVQPLDDVQVCSDELLYTLLKKHFPSDPNPRFKSSEQKLLCKMAIERSENVVAIMSTGSGKSLSWLLPARLEDKMMTVVIVPHSSLLLDHLRTAKEASIACIHWTVATEEVPQGTRILSLLSRLFSNNIHRIARTILDEGHGIMTTGSFRKDFNKIHPLAAYPVQRIILSASVALQKQPHFLDLLRRSQNTTIIRGPSDQPKISYHILRFETHKVTADNVISVVNKVRERCFSPTDSGIIYCSNISDVEDLAKKLPSCTKYHSKLSSEERSTNLRDWYNGTVKFIASTTGMINGINNPNVKAVFFYEDAYGALNCYQGGGRLSREGQIGYALYLNATLKPMSSVNDNKIDFEGRREAKIWVASNECRWLVFSQMLDGTEMPCSRLPGAVPCDFCSPNSPLTTELKLITQRPSEKLTFDDEDHFYVDKPPTSNEFSATVLVDSMAYKMARTSLKHKAEILSRATTEIGRNCPMCWAFHGILSLVTDLQNSSGNALESKDIYRR